MQDELRNTLQMINRKNLAALWEKAKTGDLEDLNDEEKLIARIMVDHGEEFHSEFEAAGKAERPLLEVEEEFEDLLGPDPDYLEEIDSRKAKQSLDALIDRVDRGEEPVLIRSRSGSEAVLVSKSDYQVVLETEALFAEMEAGDLFPENEEGADVLPFPGKKSAKETKTAMPLDPAYKKVLQFKITLKGIRPPIWRVVDYLSLESPKAEYLYDFGDDWLHALVLEKILDRQKGQPYPRCIKGKRACPPEDCGGIPGYYELVEAMENPGSEIYKEFLEWLEEEYDPDLFSADEITFQDPGELLTGDF